MGFNFIAGAIKKPGQLHRDLGYKLGENIPQDVIEKAAKRKDKVGARARLALTMAKMRKG